MSRSDTHENDEEHTKRVYLDIDHEILNSAMRILRMSHFSIHILTTPKLLLLDLLQRLEKQHSAYLC